MPTRHRKGDVDPRLGDKLEQVKGDIISWALAMPKEERDSIIARPERYSEAIAISIEDAALAGDSVRAFVDACLVPGDPSVEMGKANLHEAYRAFCQAMGFQAKERTKFLHLLKLILPGCHIERHRGKDATGQRCMVPSRWVGLQFVSGLFHEPEHSTSANPAYHCISSRLSEGGIDALLNEGGSDARGGGSDGGSDAREGASDPPQIQLGQGFSEIGSDGSDGSHVRLTLGDSFHSIDSKKEGETVQNPSDGYFSSEPSDPPSDPTLETSTMQGLSVDQMPPSGASDPHPKASDPTGASDPHSGAKLIHRRTGEIATMVRGDEDGFIWVSPADGGENRLVAASDWRAIAG